MHFLGVHYGIDLRETPSGGTHTSEGNARSLKS
jgi:hypothetical protein